MLYIPTIVERLNTEYIEIEKDYQMDIQRLQRQYSNDVRDKQHEFLAELAKIQKKLQSLTTQSTA